MKMKRKILNIVMFFIVLFTLSVSVQGLNITSPTYNQSISNSILNISWNTDLSDVFTTNIYINNILKTNVNSSWVSNTSLVTGLSLTLIDQSYTIVYNFSGNNKWTAIMGEYEGVFYGYQWNGTSWISNTSLVTGLTDVGDRSSPTMIYNFSGNNKWTLISGELTTNYNGYQWNETSWVSNTSLVTGLTAYGYDNPFLIYNFSGNNKWTLISGNLGGLFQGYEWNGTSWVSNTSLVTGLTDVGTNSYPTIVYNFSGNNKWNLISGSTNNDFFGFTWNGTSWVNNNFLETGLISVGYDTPSLMYNFSGNNKWTLISGSTHNNSYGYTWNNTLNYTTSLNLYAYNLSIGQNYLNITTSDLDNDLIENEIQPFYLTTNSQLNITAKNGSTTINSFSVNITDINTADKYYYSTTTGLIQTDLLKTHNYSILLDATNFAYSYQNKTISNSYEAINFSLTDTNSIYITIRNESNAVLILNSTHTLIGNLGSRYTASTTTGYLNWSNLPADTYKDTITATGYSNREYSFTIADRTTQNLTAYLNAGTALLLTTKTTTGSVIPSVLIQMFAFTNGTLNMVESKYTNIQGQAQFSVLNNTFYSFNASKTGYNSVYFSLNPVLFSSYDIAMSSSTAGNYTPSAYVNFYPTNFYNGRTGIFTFQIISPYSSLTSYSYTLTFPSKVISNSGSLARGQTFTDSFNITNATANQNVTLYYEFLLSNGLTTNFSQTFPIIIPAVNRTLANMGEDNFGFAIGDRIILVVGISLVCFGVGYAVGGSMFGMILAIINTLIFIRSGFVPSAIFWVSLVIGVFIIIAEAKNG